MTRSNQWQMVTGDISWKDYGATYGRSQDSNCLMLAVFTNLHDHDTSFKNKYLLRVYQEQIKDILGNSSLSSACICSGVESQTKGIRIDNELVVITNEFKRIDDGLQLFEALVSYGSYSGSSDDYYGDNAYKLFKQAGMKPFTNYSHT